MVKINESENRIMTLFITLFSGYSTVSTIGNTTNYSQMPAVFFINLELEGSKYLLRS
jgi:hypothetical protein